MLLPNFGIESQHKLLHAKILVIGGGGLGCPCIQQLVAAGVGTIGICDGDFVEISNLHRQIIFDSNDIGKKKVDILKSKLESVNPNIHLNLYDNFLDNSLAIKLFTDYDLIIDCTDDINTRYLINDACVLLNKPLIFGAVFQFEGQIAVFNCDQNHINLRDLFEELIPNQIGSCNETGTLGAITGIVGIMQALEAIKYVTNMDGLLKNELLICNFISYQHYKVSISKSTRNIQFPKTVEEFLSKNYQQICRIPIYKSIELNQKDFLQKIKTELAQVIDVRDDNEKPNVDWFPHEKIPLRELIQHPEKIDPNKTTLLFCHAGIRSEIAAEFLIEECKRSNIFHLKGGLLKWNTNE